MTTRTPFADELQRAIPPLLSQATNRRGGTPGIAAAVTTAEGNVFEGSAGVRCVGQDAHMSSDTVLRIFSATKPLTAVCALLLIQEGRLKLSDPAAAYLPELKDVQVLTGFSTAGEPQLRAPARPISVDDLFLHTSGFGYEIFSGDELAYRQWAQLPSVIAGTRAAYPPILLHDPGERWTYGAGIDWLGFLVEAVAGERLSAFMSERLLAPLEMHETGFAPSEAMRERSMAMHLRSATGALTSDPAFELPQPPEVDCGGHGIYTTALDYMKFIRMVLNEGMGPRGQRVLSRDSWRLMGCDGLLKTGLACSPWKSSIPDLSNEGELIAGIECGWTYSFLTNRRAAPTGLSAGSLTWAGLANCYFWIDIEKRIGGFWGTQVLPFVDAAAFPAYLEFQAATYAALRGARGSTHSRLSSLQ